MSGLWVEEEVKVPRENPGRHSAHCVCPGFNISRVKQGVYRLVFWKWRFRNTTVFDQAGLSPELEHCIYVYKYTDTVNVLNLNLILR